MSIIQKASRFLFVLLAAVAAYALLSLPPLIITHYEKISSISPLLGYMYVGGVVLSFTLLLILALWFALFLWRNARPFASARRRQARDITQMTLKEQREEIQQQMRETQEFIEKTPVPSIEEAQIRERYDELHRKLESQTLELVAFGTVSSGKSSLLNTLAGREVFRTDARAGTTITRNEIVWSEFDKVLLVDTPGLSEIHGAEREFLARRAARDADLVLFVLDGPLKDSESRILALLVQMKKRVLICLNKADWFTDADLPLLLQQITEQVKGLVPGEDVVAIRAASTARTRVRILPDGTETEESITVEPDITALAERMRTVIEHNARGILLANLLLRSRGLVEDAKELVQASLDQHAAELVTTYMWQAGSIAALSPFPVVDVAAGLTISSKMVVDLARTYHQNLTVEAAVRMIRELSKTVLATLGVTAATPAVATVIASLLKTVPGVGTLAGGALQGLTQAFVTRWIGRVFIEYFRNEMRGPQGGLDFLARAQWKEITNPTELVQLVQEGASRLSVKEHRCV